MQCSVTSCYFLCCTPITSSSCMITDSYYSSAISLNFIFGYVLNYSVMQELFDSSCYYRVVEEIALCNTYIRERVPPTELLTQLLRRLDFVQNN